MRAFERFVLFAAVAGALSMAGAVPSFAHAKRYHHHVIHHHRHGAYAFVRRGGDYGSRNERDCMRSPSSLRFKPCVNRQ